MSPAGGSITAVSPGDGFEHWHHVTCRDFSLTECRRMSDRNFAARISTRELGALALSDTSITTPQDQLVRLTRSAEEIRRDPREYFMTIFMVRGSAALEQNGRDYRMQPGDFAVYDQSKPFSLEFSRESNSIVMRIPRPMLTSRLPDAHRLTARPIRSGSKLGTLTASLVCQLFHLDEAPRYEVVCRLSASVMDVLAATLDSEFADTMVLDRDRARRLAQVKQFIMDNLDDCDLDVDTIAEKQNMAPRTLNRLFAAEGTTPTRWLWQQRLAGTYNALVEGRVRNVTDAAMNFGFSDLSHFSRAFKKAFGVSPHMLMRHKTGRQSS